MTKDLARAWGHESGRGSADIQKDHEAIRGVYGCIRSLCILNFVSHELGLLRLVLHDGTGDG